MNAPVARRWDTGLVRPYRPKPDNFREVYIRLGWDKAIEEELQANWRCIRRWIEEEGREELAAARAAYVADQRARKRRYVAGRTMTAVEPKAIRADAQLRPGLMRSQQRDLGRDVQLDMRVDNEDLSDVMEIKP